MPGNKSEVQVLYGFLYGMASASARLFLFKNGSWKYYKDSYMNVINKPCLFLSHTIGSTRPNTNCLAVLNGICTKRNTAQFELLLFENEVNNT